MARLFEAGFFVEDASRLPWKKIKNSLRRLCLSCAGYCFPIRFIRLASRSFYCIFRLAFCGQFSVCADIPFRWQRANGQGGCGFHEI
jgi:hypothetical protein